MRARLAEIEKDSKRFDELESIIGTMSDVESDSELSASMAPRSERDHRSVYVGNVQHRGRSRSARIFI